MHLLVEFTLRLSFGLALAMLLASPKLVTSGYYRNNLYVVLGLNVLASLVVWQLGASTGLALTIAATIAAYVGSVAWLYERPAFGQAMLALVAGLTFAAAWLIQPLAGDTTSDMLRRLDLIAGGLLLGTTMAAMLLGHWYLNAPGMSLAPLHRLIVAILIAVGLRAILGGVGFALAGGPAATASTSQLLLLGLRWLAGIVGVAATAFLARQTLKIPNTQSATGILYVSVIGAFLGELTSQMLSAETLYPV